MTERQAQFLKDCCDRDGVDCRVYEDYSGRGMYGRHTHGLVVKSVTRLMTAAINAMRGMTADELHDVPDMLDFRTDSMGYDTIVY